MKSFEQAPQWIKSVVFLVITLVLAGFLFLFSQISGRSYETVTLLTSVQASAYKMSATEWAIISKGQVEPEDAENVSRTREEIQSLFDQARALSPNNADLASASEALNNYLVAIDEEIALLTSGNLEEAKRLDEEKVDPTFEFLSESLSKAKEGLAASSGRNRQIASTASAILILLAGIVITMLWSRNQQAWEQNLKVMLEKESLSKEAEHHQEVQKYAAKIEEHNAKLMSWTYAFRQIAGIHETAELMDTTVKITSERFSYSHVGIYIVNEQKNTAFLQAVSSEEGRRLVGHGIHITPDRRNPLYLAVTQNRYSITSDLDGPSFFRDENFPKTRSQIVLPLAIRGKVIGALDLHSEESRAFETQDAEILQMLGDMIAISIENIRLAHETQLLVGNMQSGMMVQARETWSKLTSRHTPAYQYTPAGVRPIFQIKKESDSEGLIIPLVLHGQNIGSIKLRRKGVSSSWSEQERIMVEKISEQVSLALENSRLVDEAQKNALRDKMIASFSSRVRETLDIESVARTATTELRKIFDLKEAEISIGSS
jgi:hypothetical protein